jgi:hypothetical protein
LYICNTHGEIEMLCVLNGIEIDIPEEVIRITQSKGMVGIAGNTISESDVARVDEAAQDIRLGKHTLPLCWRRLYFELADGEQAEWPVGRQSGHLLVVWELTSADLWGLRKA